MKQINIIYGSTGGNTQLTCEYIRDELKKAKKEVKLIRAEIAKPEDLDTCQVLILASPTYYEGQLEPHFMEFFAKVQNHDLKAKVVALISLGDPKYHIDYHLEAAQLLKNYVENNNGKLALTPLMISGSPIPRLDNSIKNWTKKLLTLANE